MACSKCSGMGDCHAFFIPLNDLLSVINGKWKIFLILCLASEPKRFNELKKCHGISPRILSKELKELEMNGIINRTEMNDSLKTVLYSLTEIGKELIPIILQLQSWGKSHREKVIAQIQEKSDND